MYSIPLVTTKGNGIKMKQQTFIDAKGNIVARGRITEIAIDLLLNDGTRFYSTKSDNYTLDFIKQLDIVKVTK
jgi:predicted Fe-Mo cluster-binding NifX family protein